MSHPLRSSDEATSSARATLREVSDSHAPGRRLVEPQRREAGGGVPRSSEGDRRNGTDQPDLLRAYFREVGPLPVLTAREEAALAQAIEAHSGALRTAVLAIPFTARFLVARWKELRGANRVTAALSATPAGQRPPDTSARIDRKLRRVSTLLARRAGLAAQRDGRSRAERARIDEQIQKLLLHADLSPRVLQEALAALREHHAALPQEGAPSARTRSSARLAREIGLPLASFRERMREIEAHARAHDEARNRFVRHNLKLVGKIAGEFSGMGVPFLDLIQEGNLGLMRGVEKFDHRRGLKFSTYGSWWIRQACIRAIQNQSRTIRLPAHLYDRIMRLQRARVSLWNQLGRPPDRGELSAKLGMREREVERLLHAYQKPVSLETPLYDSGDGTVEDGIADALDPDLGDAIDRDRAAQKIGDLLPRLGARERQVLRWRFGLGGEQPYTLEEIGDRLELSRERIRQIESAALATLRRKIEENQILDADRDGGGR
jgi:RNA polymerase primary sigma factor